MSSQDIDTPSEASLSQTVSTGHRNQNPNPRQPFSRYDSSSVYSSSEKNIENGSNSSIFRMPNPNRKPNTGHNNDSGSDFDSLSGSQKGDFSHFRQGNQFQVNVRSRSSEKEEEEVGRMQMAVGPPGLMKGRSMMEGRIDRGEVIEENPDDLMEESKRETGGGMGLQKGLETIQEYPESLKRINSSPNFKHNNNNMLLASFEEIGKLGVDRRSSIERKLTFNSLVDFRNSFNSHIHQGQQAGIIRLEASTQESFQGEPEEGRKIEVLPEKGVQKGLKFKLIGKSCENCRLI